MADMMETVKCSGCGMDIAPDQAATTLEKDGMTLYFCSQGCADAFAAGSMGSM
jgi:ribosomal protein L24E